MKRLILFAVAGSFMLATKPAMAQSFELLVEHEHTMRNCSGALVITPERIEYRTDHKKDARAWRYTDLRQIKIESPTSIELVSYEDQKRMLGRDRVFKFKVLEGEITSEIGFLLMERATRPVVTSVIPAKEDAPVFEVPVKHLHHFGGCIGMLKIFPNRVIYESGEVPSDSRYWRYGDIQNFSQSERYRFEIVTFEDKLGGPKAYNFQLREAMPAQAYDYLWARVYPLKFHREAGSLRSGNNSVTPGERQERKQ